MLVYWLCLVTAVCEFNKKMRVRERRKRVKIILESALCFTRLKQSKVLLMAHYLDSSGLRQCLTDIELISTKQFFNFQITYFVPIGSHSLTCHSIFQCHPNVDRRWIRKGRKCFNDHHLGDNFVKRWYPIQQCVTNQTNQHNRNLLVSFYSIGSLEKLICERNELATSS